jgi:hypothetical protein
MSDSANDPGDADANELDKTHGFDNLLARKLDFAEDLNDPMTIADRVFQLWWNWADFHLYVISPHIESVNPPVLIEPETISPEEKEFVYPIHDGGAKLSAAKSQDMFFAGKSMCKLFYTIEKIITLLVDRLKSGGIDTETEVQVAFGGHLIAQRKAFESIINLSYNVVVTNFDPGMWGDEYMKNIKYIADKGYGYPSESPRQPYKTPHHSQTTGNLRS